MLDKVLANAIDFAEPNSQITLHLAQHHDQLIIEITNIGPILPQDMQDQLLESMVSIRATDDPQQVHLGLGLYIANMLAMYHNGKMRIANSQAGQGVTVKFVFKL